MTDPFPKLEKDDYEARNKAWDHAQALDNINAAAHGTTTATAAEWLKILGGGLFAQSLCLHRHGVPLGSGSDPSVVELAIDGIGPWEYALLYGGFWGVQSDTPSGPGKYVTRVWRANKIVHEQSDPSPVDIAEIGMAHGLNAELDGPA